jgi:hypothetical protein
MATEYKSPLGLLDYIVPDRLEQDVISAFARPLKQGEPAPDYGNFTPKIDPNNPQGLSNIETLLGYAVAPQNFKTPTNRQMIDASILRAGLELMKPNQPGENTASALLRALDQAGQPAKTLAEAQLAQAKAAAKKVQPQVTITPAKIYGFYKVGQTLMKTNKDFRDAVIALKGTGLFASEAQALKAITNNAMGIESQTGGGISESIKESLNILSKNVSKETSVADIEGNEDVTKKIISNMQEDPFADMEK